MWYRVINHSYVHSYYRSNKITVCAAECKVAVITARSSKIVAERMASLGVKYIYQGEENKGKALTKLINKLGIKFADVAYVGDDVIDLPAMKKVYLPIAVADAHPSSPGSTDRLGEPPDHLLPDPQPGRHPRGAPP